MSFYDMFCLKSVHVIFLDVFKIIVYSNIYTFLNVLQQPILLLYYRVKEDVRQDVGMFFYASGHN